MPSSTQRPTRTASALLPLEEVNSSVRPWVAYLNLFERATLERVSRACREEVRAPVLWRQLIVPAASKEAPLVNGVLTWLFSNERYSCASLASLDLKGCTNLTDEPIKAIAAGCASLTSLDVAGCSNLTDESITAVAAGCASLTARHVRGCPTLTA
jgi:hypothetical protein